MNKSIFPAILIFLAFIFYNDYLVAQTYGVKQVEFEFKNSKSFDDDALQTAVAISSAEQFSARVLSSDIPRLKKFYFDKGFFDAAIDTSVSYNTESEETIVRFIISENRRYKMDSIFFKGLDNISPEAKNLLAKVKKLKLNDFYDRVLIIKNSNEIIDMLQNNGYMNARLMDDSGTVVNKYDALPESKLTITLNFDGTDTLFYFGKTKINIINNKHEVPKELLYDQIEYNEGEIYSNEKRLNAERDISKIAIIQSSRIKVDKIQNDLKVDFIADVTLTNKYEIKPSIQATNIENSFYIGGDIRYLDKYFLGNGRTFTVDFNALYNSVALNRFELSAAVTQPNIFNKSTALTDKVTVGLYNREDSKNFYLGNLTSLQYNFSPYTFFNNATFDLNEEIVRFIYIDDNSEPITLLNTVLSTTFIHDGTDDLFNPTKGFYHSITVGSAGLLSKLIINTFDPNWYYSQYIELGTTNKFFTKLGSRNTVFATKFVVGDNIEYGSGDRLVPVQSLYRYFSGGTNSLRGWKAKENGILTDKAQGGNFLIEGSLELRRFLFPGSKNFKKNLGLVFFIDYGNVWESQTDFRYDQIAIAIGIGPRYNLFVGPIRIDFGARLFDPSAAEDERWLFENISWKKFAISFGIGQAF